MVNAKRDIGNKTLKDSSSKGVGYIDGHQYSLIIDQKQYPLHKRLEAIALSNRLIEATESGDGYRVRITLDVPIRFTRSEVEWLVGVTDNWAGWCDSPRHCLAELGLLLEAAIATVGGAK